MRHRFLLSDLVPEAASNHPGKVAASCDDLDMTWEQLDERIGRLAAALLAAKVAPGDRVGIYVHKSLESLVAIHGILRAGAAFVPIDPMAPAASMATIINDCGISTIVTHELRRTGVARVLDSVELSTVIGLDQPLDGEMSGLPRTISWDDVDALDPASPVPVLGDDLAYVMYTSGSTGTPKGIMHTHRSGLSYATMSAELYGLGPHDRMANFSPLHFDMSTFEILAGVSAGATVVLVPEPYLRLPASLAQYISEQSCTTLYTVPSLFQQLLTRGALADQDLSAVRWVLPAGEVFPPEPLRELMALLPKARFSNVYGPAEVNQCTFYHFGSASDRPLPIGFACADAELAIVDDDDRPIHDESRGELLVRSATMMAGYWNRPDLDERGIVSIDGPGGMAQRWYRTGDVVSRRPMDAPDKPAGLGATDGAVADLASGIGVLGRDECLLYHGRMDNQVKIRGNRVELEMVEAAVASLAAIEQAVVGVRVAPGGDSQLVARFVPTTSGDLARWRQDLAAGLPAYAVPTMLEEVSTFPLTPSGKIDRRSVRAEIAAG